MFLQYKDGFNNIPEPTMLVPGYYFSSSLIAEYTAAISVSTIIIGTINSPNVTAAVTSDIKANTMSIAYSKSTVSFIVYFLSRSIRSRLN